MVGFLIAAQQFRGASERFKAARAMAISQRIQPFLLGNSPFSILPTLCSPLLWHTQPLQSLAAATPSVVSLVPFLYTVPTVYVLPHCTQRLFVLSSRLFDARIPFAGSGTHRSISE